jgi:hypothetical protein
MTLAKSIQIERQRLSSIELVFEEFDFPAGNRDAPIRPSANRRRREERAKSDAGLHLHRWDDASLQAF